MRVAREQVCGVTIGHHISLNAKESDLIRRAADLIDKIDQLATRQCGIYWTDAAAERTDLVLGEQAIRDTAKDRKLLIPDPIEFEDDGGA